MEEKDRVSAFLGVGVKWPPQVDKMTGKFMTSSYEDNIRESIQIILMTKKGERIMRPEFGCGIYQYAFGTMDYTSFSRMEKEVEEALYTWEPRITDITVNVSQDSKEEGRLNIAISYVVRATNNPYNMVYPFYINEGLI